MRTCTSFIAVTLEIAHVRNFALLCRFVREGLPLANFICYFTHIATKDVQIRLHKERFNVINDHLRRVEVEITELEARIAQNPNDTELLGEVREWLMFSPNYVVYSY